ncbi:MAG: hypothetical protein M1834_008973 [Cirrosporium novae-zelandiae]|nr:MAG: hypothetical protein M1834_008973 [Cirrosporium novae-zelandiae]
MVIGLLIVTAIPTVTGIAEAVHQQRSQNQEKAEAERMKKALLLSSGAPAAPLAEQGLLEAPDILSVHGKLVVLRDGKAWLDEVNPAARKTTTAHTAQAFYVSYPFPDHLKERGPKRGLVSSVATDPPMLNWIFVDKDTGELRYGNRTASMEHVVGSWDWTEGKEGLDLEGVGVFVAVEEEEREVDGAVVPGGWALRFGGAAEVEGVRALVGGRKCVPVELKRKELEEEDEEEEKE